MDSSASVEVMTNNNSHLTTTITVSSLALLTIGIYYFMGGFTSKSSTDNKKKSATDKSKTDPKVNDASKYPAGDLIIYFGSQTGTAEGFARVLMNEGKSKGFNAKIQDLEDFKPETLATTKLAIFLMATYGEGEPTDNAIKFYKWLKNENTEVETTYLSNLKYSVFGLGNRQYEHFNAMGKATDTLLNTLGASRAFDYGDGDDDDNLEEDYDNWKNVLWPALLAQYHPDYAAGSLKRIYSKDEIEKFNQKIELSYDIQMIDKLVTPHTISMNPSLENHTAMSAKANSSTRFYFNAVNSKIKINRELRGIYNNISSNNNNTAVVDINNTNSTTTNNNTTNTIDIGSTRHIELDLSEHKLKYNTADNLACIPQNDITTVEHLAKTQGYDLNACFQIIPVGNSTPEEIEKFKYPFPTPCSIKDALLNYVDIHGAPKHSTLTYLMPYITDDQQKNWLVHILSKENRKFFLETIEGSGRSLYDLLTNELTSCKIPFIDFLHIAPNMQPRYYTISSSSSVYPNTVHITVSITNTLLKSGKSVPGLCSTYLGKLQPHPSLIGTHDNNSDSNDNSYRNGTANNSNTTNHPSFSSSSSSLQSCKIFIRPSSFKLPTLLSTPIIMIGPGTGIAPMRALIQEREYQYKAQYGDDDSIKNSKVSSSHRANGASTTITTTSASTITTTSATTITTTSATTITTTSATTTTTTTDNSNDEKTKISTTTSATTIDSTIMSNVLYFGCKRKNEDYIYADELESYQRNGVLTKLHLAFSRENPDKKCYVQHLIKQSENATSLLQDLDKGGYIYVCGATAMGEDVHKTILEVLIQHKGMDKSEAEKYVKSLQASGRYVQELWTA